MRRLIGRTSAAVAVGLTVGVLALPAEPAAAANLRLVSTDPAAASNVAAVPRRITLVFDAEPSKEATTVSVLGPRGENASGGDVKVDGNIVTIGFKPTVLGPHTVAWGTLAPDGDPVGDAFTFTLTALTPATASPSLATPDVPEGTSTPDRARDEPSESPTPWWPYAVGAVLVIALLAGAGHYAWRRLRR